MQSVDKQETTDACDLILKRKDKILMFWVMAMKARSRRESIIGREVSVYTVYTLSVATKSRSWVKYVPTYQVSTCS
jgi:hypothetical protein